MASTADIRNGVVLSIDGQLWNVIEFQHVKPGKGGAFVRTKLKNVVSGKTVDRTYNAGAKIDIENVDRRDFTYLYNDAAGTTLAAARLPAARSTFKKCIDLITAPPRVGSCAGPVAWCAAPGKNGVHYNDTAP